MPTALTAFITGSIEDWGIEPASPRREWMDAVPDKVAYRCLPLVMANQMGWVIKSPATFSATWSGGAEMSAVKIAFAKGHEKWSSAVLTHFGSGIVTFHLPYLFRTAPGLGLLVRGPTNAFKDGAAPLDGLIETDWAPYTFTMNWKLTRRNTPVWFQKGEPICMVAPYPLELLEEQAPRIAPLASDKLADEDFTRWARGRQESLRKQAVEGGAPFSAVYMRGRRPDGTVVEEHRTNFKLKPFEQTSK